MHLYAHQVVGAAVNHHRKTLHLARKRRERRTMEKEVENNENEKTEKENEGKMQAFSYLAISRRPSPENCRRRRKNEGTKLGFEDEDAVKIRL